MKQEIIELQNKAINKLYHLSLSGKDKITLKAPTGSGKTYMMSSFMNKMLDNNKNIVFIVSTLSKGKLANQSYESFENLSLVKFKNLKPFLISSGNENNKNQEYSLHIDNSCNVFVLPTAQYTKKSRINTEKTLLVFLQDCKNSAKKIILIRDESHIKTNNLSALSDYFSQVINFSATPTDNIYDVCISEVDAVNANLIKSVEYIDTKSELEKELLNALEKFKEIQSFYFKQGIRPAFIIQISNEINAVSEMEIIKKVLNNHSLNWVYFVEKENMYETNSKLNNIKNKSLWQNYIKQNDFPIDVIIFKMVITEGFDIPRACMLFQVRDSKSKQLDEQVVGRVRRNPCLMNYEMLDKKTQEIFSKAYVYGLKPQEEQFFKIKTHLKGGEHLGLFENEIIKEFKPFKITTLQEIPLSVIDISDCLKEEKLDEFSKSIFDIYKDLQNVNDTVKQKQEECVKSYSDWFLFNANIDEIKNKVLEVIEDYDKYGEIKEVELREDIYSFFDKSKNNLRVKSWMWTCEEDNFSFDSDAELEWLEILEDVAYSCCKKISIDDKEIYLFGKNYIEKSNIKYEYYDLKKHTSYPDFIFKDKKDKIHLFEVKSLNHLNGNDIDFKEYREKIEKLKKAYLFASKKTGYIFYIPIKIGNDWRVWRCENGIEDKGDKIMNKDMFKKYLKDLQK